MAQVPLITVSAPIPVDEAGVANHARNRAALAASKRLSAASRALFVLPSIIQSGAIFPNLVSFLARHVCPPHPLAT